MICVIGPKNPLGKHRRRLIDRIGVPDPMIARFLSDETTPLHPHGEAKYDRLEGY